MFRCTLAFPRIKCVLPAAAANRFDFAAVRSNALLHHHQHRQHQQQQTTTATLNFFAAAVTSAGAWNPAVTASATLFSLTPHLLHARRHCSSSNTNSNSANTPSSAAVIAATATTAPTQQRVPCNVSEKRLAQLLEKYRNDPSMYAACLFNARKARGDVATFAAMHSVPENDPFDRCISCGCKIDEHLTQQQLDARFQLQLQEEKQRRKLEEQKHQLVTRINAHNAKSLRWGTTDARFFAKHWPWHMLAREQLFRDVCSIVAHTPHFNPGKVPFMFVCSTPRQGKTLLLDELAKANLYDQQRQPRVFNMSFNGTFPVIGPSYTVDEAIRECVRRLYCAAYGDMREDCLRGFLDGHKRSATIEGALELLSTTCALPPNAPALFLFDEITHLTDLIDVKADAATRANSVAEFYSRLANLISTAPPRCVVCSGFSGRGTGISNWAPCMRPVYFASLTPIRTVKERRPMLVMIAALLRCALRSPKIVHREAAEALFWLEALKCSPGALGSLLDSAGIYLLRGAAEDVGHVRDCATAVCCGSLIDVLAVMSTTAADRIDKASDLIDHAEFVHSAIQVDRLSSAGRNRPWRVFVEPLWLLSALGHNIPVNLSGDRRRLGRRHILQHAADPHQQKALLDDKTRDDDDGDDEQATAPANQAVVELFNYFKLVGAFSHGFVKLAVNCESEEVRRVAIGSLKRKTLEDAVVCGLRVQRALRAHALAHNVVPGCRDAAATLTSDLRSFLLKSQRTHEVTELLREEEPSRPITVLNTPLVVATSGSSNNNNNNKPLSVEFSAVAFNLDTTVSAFTVDEPDVAAHLCGSTASPTEAVKMLLRPKLEQSGGDSSSNNSIADIIFHEYVGDGDRKRLVQFWVQVEHTTNHPILRQPTSPYRDDMEQQQKKTRSVIEQQLFTTEKQQPESDAAGFVNQVHDGLSNAVLQHPDCIIDHVVHIILTPVHIDFDTTVTNTSLNAHLGRLQSYSLYVVNPGTAGFENLLSQPVALTMPLMDSHDVHSWMEPVPHDLSKWKDYIGVKRGLSASIRDGRERAVYEKMVADNERHLDYLRQQHEDRIKRVMR